MGLWGSLLPARYAVVLFVLVLGAVGLLVPDLAWPRVSAQALTVQFNKPDAVTVTADAIYVADYGNNRIVKLGLDGHPISVWGKKGRRPGQFNIPAGVTTDAVG